MKESFNGKKAVIIYGPPGGGKGTIAELLARNLDLINFDTGQYLRKILYNPEFKKNKIIQKERLLNASGELNTPSWVLKIVSQEAKKVAAAGWGIAFQGSPRTIFEAFGDQKQVGLIKILEKLYGRENVYIFELKVSPENSVKRNSHRVVCGICGQPSLFLYTGKLRCCAFCAGPLKKRADDNFEIIKKRLIEYHKRTQPILKELKKRNYRVFKINGEPAPYKVFLNTIQKIK